VKQYLMLAVLLVAFLGVTIWMTSLGSVGIFKVTPAMKIVTATVRHLQIVAVAELLAIIVGIPIGFLTTRKAFRFVSPILIGVANVGQTVPTLAFIGIAAAFLGMGYTAAVVALFVYATLPIVRNTHAGIRSVDPAVKEAAQGMGMSKWQVTTGIELPLARPIIMAGIRTSTVVNVGTAAVAGIAVRVMPIVIQGAAPTAALAIVLDALLGGVEEWMTPRGLKVMKQAQWQQQ